MYFVSVMNIVFLCFVKKIIYQREFSIADVIVEQISDILIVNAHSFSLQKSSYTVVFAVRLKI